MGKPDREPFHDRGKLRVYFFPLENKSLVFDFGLSTYTNLLDCSGILKNISWLFLRLN